MLTKPKLLNSKNCLIAVCLAAISCTGPRTRTEIDDVDAYLPRHSSPFPYTKSQKITANATFPLYYSTEKSDPIIRTTNSAGAIRASKKNNFALRFPKRYSFGSINLPLGQKQALQLAFARSEIDEESFLQGNLDLGWKLDGKRDLTPFISFGMRGSRRTIATTKITSETFLFIFEGNSDSVKQVRTHSSPAIEIGGGLGLKIHEWNDNVVLGGMRVSTFTLAPDTGTRLVFASANLAAHLKIIENVYYSLRLGGNAEPFHSSGSVYGEIGLLVALDPT